MHKLRMCCNMHFVFTSYLFLFMTSPYVSSMPCLWKVCDQIKMPNPREGNVLDIYNCDFTTSDFDTRSGDTSKTCPMPREMETLRDVSFKFRMNDVGLRSFPPLLCSFTYLTELDLQRNALQDLPGDLPANCFGHLKQLLLNNNQMRQLDLSLVLKFPSLEVLEIEDNQLDSIFLSQHPPNDTRLRTIKAARSNIKTVDMSIVRLTSLNLLDLSRNKIGLVTNLLKWDWKFDAGNINSERRALAISGKLGLQYRYRLNVLLRGNVFSHGFRKGRLWGVNLGHSLLDHKQLLNAMITMQRSFGFLSIDVGGGRVECDCHAQSVVTLLRKYLTPERLTQVGISKPFDSLLTLKCSKPKAYRHRSIVDLTQQELFCRRHRNCPLKCSCTEYMNGSYVGINCQHANLNRLPDKLPMPLQPHAMFELLMAGNNVSQKRYPKLPYASRVSKLDLRRNHITNVKGLILALRDFTRLSVLDLRHNPIRTLSPELLNLTDAETPHIVRLSPDQLNCHCDYFREQALRRVLKIFPNFYDKYCLHRGHRQRIQTYRAHFCRRQELDDPKRRNMTTFKDPRIDNLPPDNQWLLIVVASAAGVIITGLLIITIVILARYCRRERRLKKSSLQLPLPLPESHIPPPARPLARPMEERDDRVHPRENPYAEYRLSFLSDTPPGQLDAVQQEQGSVSAQEDSAHLLGSSYRVATVHPRVSSKLSLGRCAEEDEDDKEEDDDVFRDDEPEQESAKLNNNTEASPGHPLSKRQRSAPRLYCDVDDDLPPGPGSRKLKGATSMPKVPPMPPPRGGSTLTRTGTLPRQNNFLLPKTAKPLETDL